jgi:predicted aconitase with swiveling domain
MIPCRSEATTMSQQFHARKVVRGIAEGAALVCPGSFSFLGDVDLATGEIIATGLSC